MDDDLIGRGWKTLDKEKPLEAQSVLILAKPTGEEDYEIYVAKYYLYKFKTPGFMKHSFRIETDQVKAWRELK